MRKPGTYWAYRTFGLLADSRAQDTKDATDKARRVRQRQRRRDTGFGIGIGLAQVAVLGLSLKFGIPGFLLGVGMELLGIGGYLIGRLRKQQRQILQIQATLDLALQRLIEASPYSLIPGPPEPPTEGQPMPAAKAEASKYLPNYTWFTDKRSLK